MEPAQRAAAGERLIVLRKAHGQAHGVKAALVEGLGKPSAVVGELLGADDLYVTQRCVFDLHQAILAWRTAGRLSRAAIGQAAGGSGVAPTFPLAGSEEGVRAASDGSAVVVVGVPTVGAATVGAAITEAAVGALASG